MCFFLNITEKEMREKVGGGGFPCWQVVLWNVTLELFVDNPPVLLIVMHGY